ncbi:hypothetical protein TBR22_A12290 [Luteitalea sp. TBR-22]|uniref:DUF2235 domain-containing protein n=1 Tax=Luteitalea sp. TBR-22 TaxID=2802971 RepID=UPI001AF0A4D2|nr:DUF2235 domain-containing protein [Luteitalea sp. TBR-22]BCS32024.1 hypothetical protein TBR22_A12290 [Luteitalea sp. TBR-22]
MAAHPESPFTPRNLVALSDGTGNSAAKLQKTNVWRLYEALDLSTGDQVALYDDGVGTASFKPLAILGGAFGYGLKRNVLDLYMFLCRAYRCDPADPWSGDRIYALGFSRGAYTARVLAALVANVGLVQADSEAELRRLSLWAYRTYRADRFPHSWPVRLGRRVRDVVLKAWDGLRGKPAFDPARTLKPDIEFLGVWDTVAAYGLPVDELTRGWERWIWPMLPKDRRASRRIRRACHALALDDERQTFFPLLWTEHEEAQNASSTHVDEERVTQVWFAGMHSNVGGGYPDDSLSMTPLAWMAGEACKRGLRFRPALCTRDGRLPDEWSDRAVVTAPMHDSRRGLGVYYRYHPRPLERLCHDDHVDVRVSRPKIHESVLERIRQDVDGYAPATLPEHYAVVTRDGRILADEATAPNPYEHPTQRHARRLRQESALNAVWWRRVSYFLTVAATLLLVLIPLCPAREHLTWLGAPQATLASLVGLLDSVLPAMLAPWLQYYQQRPFQLLAGAIVVFGLIAWSQRLKLAITDRMRRVWREHEVRAQPVPAVSSPDDWVYRLRTSHWYRQGFHLLSYHLLPNVFGIAMLIALAGLLPLRGLFEVRSRAGLLPASTCGRPVPPLPGEPAGTFLLSPRLLCNATGVMAEKGRAYRVEMALPAECEVAGDGDPGRAGAWRDRDIPVTTTEGFSSLHAPGASVIEKALLTLAVPLRREITANWFVPVVEIGTTNPSRIAVPDGTFVAPQDGPVSMYVNDAVLPCPRWDCLYRNNSGASAVARIRRADAPPLPPLRARQPCG